MGTPYNFARQLEKVINQQVKLRTNEKVNYIQTRDPMNAGTSLIQSFTNGIVPGPNALSNFIGSKITPTKVRFSFIASLRDALGNIGNSWFRVTIFRAIFDGDISGSIYQDGDGLAPISYRYWKQFKVLRDGRYVINSYDFSTANADLKRNANTMDEVEIFRTEFQGEISMGTQPNRLLSFATTGDILVSIATQAGVNLVFVGSLYYYDQ